MCLSLSLALYLTSFACSRFAKLTPNLFLLFLTSHRQLGARYGYTTAASAASPAAVSGQPAFQPTNEQQSGNFSTTTTTHLAAIVNTLSLLTLTHHHHHRRPAHYPSIQHSHSRFSSTSQSVTGIQFTHVKHSHSHSMNP